MKKKMLETFFVARDNNYAPGERVPRQGNNLTKFV
jgi:hypothetical protein